MKIAIVGTASSAASAPIKEDWKIWSLVGNIDRWKDNDAADEWFELHEIQYLKNECKAKPEFFDLLKSLGKKLTIIEPCAELPDAKVFPKQEMINTFGGYFTSSISWLAALAAASEADTIGVWGVNCSGSNEYLEQRAGIEGYLRFAQGRGKKLQIHPDSMLFKAPIYLDAAAQRLTKKLKQAEDDMNRKRDDANYQVGYVDALKFIKLGLGE